MRRYAFPRWTGIGLGVHAEAEKVGNFGGEGGRRRGWLKKGVPRSRRFHRQRREQ